MMVHSEDSAKIKFTAARMELMKESPFFSFLALSMKPVPTDRIKRVGVDVMGTIYYNPRWLSSLTQSEVKTVIAHELGHLVTETFARGKGRDPKVWHMATDQVWNDVLQKNRFTPVEGRNGYWFFRRDLSGMTADEVYNVLEHEIRNARDNACSACKRGSRREIECEGFESFDEILTIDEVGNVCDSENNRICRARDDEGNPVNGRDCERYSERWKGLIKEAEVFAKMEGKVPGGVGRLIGEIFRPRWSPRAMLERYITMDLAEENWQYADKKKSGEVIFPAEREEELVIGFAVDTSGSMSEGEIALCKGAIGHVFSICENVKVEVVECDAEREDVYTVTRQSLHRFLRKTSFRGGGGTDYRPVIKYFNKKRPKVLLYATDLCCSTFGEKPSYDVIWLKVDGYATGEPPYGRVVQLGGEQEWLG